jgi:thiosulfate dehydrogenase (quinone) large subunit
MALLRDRRLGLVWLAARLWVGWTFLWAGWEKMSGGGWLGSTAGIDGFLNHAGSSSATAGAHASVSTWYATLVHHVFLPADGFLSYLVPIGEFAIGAGLILGVFTLGAAFFGALLNMLFMFSGSLSAGVSPIMLALELLLLGAGAAAYVYGADRYLLPALKRLWVARSLPSLHLPHPLTD